MENMITLSPFDSNKAFGHPATSYLEVSPVSNIVDDNEYDKLMGAKSTSVVTIDGSVYTLIVSDEGLSVINITTPESPSHVDSIRNLSWYRDGELNTVNYTEQPLSSIASIQIDGNTYAILSNNVRFVVLNISNPVNNFLNGSNVVYFDNDGDYLSNGTFTTVKIDNIDYFILLTYNYITSDVIIRNMTHSINKHDAFYARFYMNNASSSGWDGDITTTKIGNSYILATSIINDWFIVVNLDDQINHLKNNNDSTSVINPTIISDSDPGYGILKNATDVTAITIDGSTYALITAYADNGVQIIDISDPSSLKPISSIIDGSEFTTLHNPTGIATVTMDNFHYALVASEGDDGVQIINITNPSSPIAVSAIIDDGVYQTLGGAKDVITTEINGLAYAIVTASEDNGIQIIELKHMLHTQTDGASETTSGTDITNSEVETYCGKPISWYNIISENNVVDGINGTRGNDLIFGKNTTDYIYGLDGDDCIFGSNSSSTTIYGGFGDDVIHGGSR